MDTATVGAVYLDDIFIHAQTFTCAVKDAWTWKNASRAEKNDTFSFSVRKIYLILQPIINKGMNKQSLHIIVLSGEIILLAVPTEE